MGKVKTEQIKRIGKELMARYPEEFGNNFDDNKQMVNQLTKGATPKVRNQIAGYITRTNSLSEAQSEDTVEEESVSD